MALLIRPNNNTMDQSSKRSRRSWSTIAASHDPYASTSSLLSATEDVTTSLLISGGGKIRSRPSLGGLNRLKGSKSKRQSVPALSTNSIIRRSSNKKRVSSSSREELSREGHVKALPTSCQSTPLIRNRGEDDKSSASQQRVCFEDGPSRDDAELDVHNEQWDEIIRPKRPIDTSPTLSNNLTTATTIGTAKEVPLKFDKHHSKTATTSTTSSRLPLSSTPFFGKKFKMMTEEESSQPIPINCTSPTPQETEDETKAADETLHYDMATWQMYTRIAQARRRKAISSQSRETNCSSASAGASMAAARHGMMIQDNRQSYVSNEEEEVPQANKEEEDIGVFAFDL